MIDLHVIWYVLLGVLIAGYGILDGFDLGVGILSLFARNAHERHIHSKTIDVVWDLNEVWLLTAGGAIFAAFPAVYASVFSGFYLAFVLLLVALIFRGVSMEFRNKVQSPGWRAFWDYAFGIGSLVPALLFGVAFGNILRGLPIDANGVFHGNLLTLLNPYSLMIGVLSTAMIVMHGAVYMAMKTIGGLQAHMKKCALGAWAVFTVIYVAASIITRALLPHLFTGHLSNPLFYFFFALILVCTCAVPIYLRADKNVLAFIASSLVIATMIALAGISLFPNLVTSTLDPAFSLTIFNASASNLTLTIMLAIALGGMPVVIGYTIYFYWLFRGRVGATTPKTY